MTGAAKKNKVQEEFPLKLTIERSALLKSLARLQSIVEKRNTIPILSNIKLDASGDGLQLTATDMDILASENVTAQIEGGGALTVPAGTLYDIVRKLPDGAQIELDTNNSSSQLIVEAGSARFALSYLSAEDFPNITEGDMSHKFTIATKELLALIDKARFAMSTEETRYYLNGVYLHVAGEGDAQTLRAVATDGHRLARIETAVPAGAAGMPGVIIPRKTVNELGKLLDEAEENVEVALSDAKIRFASGNVVLVSKLVDGTFPDYERVIPEGNDKLMEVDSKLLSDSVDRVSTISTEKTRGIKFSLEPGKLTLLAQNPEGGTAKETIDVTYSASGLDIGFNSRYMLEMMGQLDGETTQFLLNDPNAPALVSDPGDVTALYVIMPMRV